MSKKNSGKNAKKTNETKAPKRPLRNIKLLTLDELKDVAGGTCDSNGPPRAQFEAY